MGGLRGGVDVTGTMPLSALGSPLTAQGVVVHQGRPHRDDRWRSRHARRGEGRGLDLPRLVEGVYWDASDLYVTGVIRVIAGIPGDFDADGDVDGRDFLIWQRGGSPKALSEGDLADWQANYGLSTQPAASTAVPEPSALALAYIGLALAARGKRI